MLAYCSFLRTMWTLRSALCAKVALDNEVQGMCEAVVWAPIILLDMT